MKTKLALVVGMLGAVLMAGTSVLAGESLSSACKEEIQTLCKDKMHKAPEAKACLIANKDKIKEGPCLEAIKEAGAAKMGEMGGVDGMKDKMSEKIKGLGQ